MLLMSTADIVILSFLGVVILATIVVGILTLLKEKRKVSNNPKKGGK